MEREFWRVIPYILGGAFGLGALLFALSLLLLRRRRTGAYWRARRQAGDRGGRLFVASSLLMLLSVVASLITGVLFLIRQPNTEAVIRGPEDLYGINLPTAEQQNTVEVVAAPTDASATTAPELSSTALPAATLTSTVALPPTNTPHPSDALAPTQTFGEVLNLTPVFSTTPRAVPAGAQMSIEGASILYAPNVLPVPQFQFDAGVKRIYLYIAFEQMENDVAWSRVLYVNGTPVQGSTQLWTQGAAGKGSFFFGNPDGYAAGSYEVRLFLGDKPVSQYRFVVTGSGGQATVE